MNSENTEKALISMGNIIEELQQHPIPADELDRAKRYYAGMFRSGFDGPFAQATKALQTLVRSNSSDYYSQTLDYIWNVDSSMLLQLAQNELDTKTFVKVVAGEV
jgi:predicted Zn-dependent peptidase